MSQRPKRILRRKIRFVSFFIFYIYHSRSDALKAALLVKSFPFLRWVCDFSCATVANISGGLWGGESEGSDDDTLQRAAAGSEQTGWSRRHEEEPAGQVWATQTHLQMIILNLKTEKCRKITPSKLNAIPRLTDVLCYLISVLFFLWGGGVEDVGRWSRMWQPWRPNWWRNRPFKRRMTGWSSSWTACRPRAWWSRGRLQKRSQRKHKHTYTLTDCVRVQERHIVTLIFIGLCYCTLTT